MLFEFVTWLLLGTVVMVVAAGAVFVERRHVVSTMRQPGRRTKRVLPHVALLLSVLLLNRLFRHLGQEISWAIGWNITGILYAIEGDFVATVQTIASPRLTALFSFVYLYGYVFLGVFPVIAYWVLEDATPIRKTLVAFALNYALGLVGYTLFIAYGPRNLLPGAVQELLYTMYPQTQVLTSTVNANTNAFPSLHTSISVTVALLARRTRDQYPGWYVLSVLLTGLIIISTMYLGIHWVTDIVAGGLLAVVSIRVADHYHDFDLPQKGRLIPDGNHPLVGQQKE